MKKAKKVNKFREYVEKHLRIDASKLKVKDAKKLATFYLRAIGIETPMVAKSEAKTLGIEL